MSSNHLENTIPNLRSPGERLLVMLKTRGPQIASDLGKLLNTTGENARQLLTKLASEGLVESQNESRGVGRPRQVWRLTAAGHNRFPDTHAQLTTQLIQSIRGILGEAALDKLISAREVEGIALYQSEMASASTLAQRVEKLAGIRKREGYMAEYWQDGSDFFLAENHCPICAAAASCLGFCQSEMETFRSVLGEDIEITREEHILSGARRCLYRIHPRSAELN